MLVCRGGNLGGTGGDGPPKFEVGDGSCIRPPSNILRSSVVGCARKYEKGKKRFLSCCEEGVRHLTK